MTDTTTATTPTTTIGLDFGLALQALKHGLRVARSGWNGKGMWLSLSCNGTREVPAENFWSPANRAWAEQQPNGTAMVLPSITMKTATGEILMGWLASQTDMLAEDWQVLDDETDCFVAVLHSSQFEQIKMELAEELAEHDEFADKMVRIKDGPPDCYRYIERSGAYPQLAFVEDSEARTLSFRRDLLEVVPASEGGYPVDDEPQGTAEDLRPLIEAPARRVTLTFTHPTIGDEYFNPVLVEAIKEFLPYMEACESPYSTRYTKEPRYPFTASNGVVVDVLAWKTVDDIGGLPAFPFMSGAQQTEAMTRVIRETAEAVRAICGTSFDHAFSDAVKSGTGAVRTSVSADGDIKVEHVQIHEVGTIPAGTTVSDELVADLLSTSEATFIGFDLGKEPAQETVGLASGNRRVSPDEPARANPQLADTPHMTPTIGRRVWYRPDPRSGASNFCVRGFQPLDAGIVYVWSDRMVNLDVCDHNGHHHAFQSVTLIQPGEIPPRGAYAEWMPFQVAQKAAK